MILKWVIPLLFVSETFAGDWNWGVKTQCFLIRGEVLCPGCNQRRGLYCPKVPKSLPPCDNGGVILRKPIDSSSEETSISDNTELPTTSLDNTNRENPLPTTESEDDSYVDVISNEISNEDLFAPTTTTGDDIETLLDTTTVKQETTTSSNIDSRYYRYLFRSSKKIYPTQRRMKRQITESCGYVGDCPCPLVCCERADGCGKECMPGIRAAPHYGTG